MPSKDAVGNRPRAGTPQLRNSLEPSKDTIRGHLKPLGKTYKTCRILPHELNEIQAKRRLEVCKQLLALPKDDHFMERDMSEEQGERMHQDLRVMEERYQGYWDTNMMTDYRRSLTRHFPKSTHRRRALKRSFLELND
ncbi:hypothetical protein EVAR_65093_1 [Eumeta japonica]|uniref:Uncharacterized protein n=1 Tax=Eumeta variegata TaxID=151549 RepID=A0A4C1Z5N5_EUMVA|nr:hypothetical protein EVAR_65093_1 [Eumeta japonica]